MADRKQQQGGQGGRGQAQGGRGPSQGGRGPAQQGARGQGQQGGRGGQQRGASRSADRGQEDLPPPPTGPRPTPRLRIRYQDEVRPDLIKEFKYQNVMQAPKIEKVVINIGMGEALSNSQAMDNAVGDLQLITGQRPVVTRARRSIATFKLRTGDPIGCMVTLRGARMYDFLDKLFNVALPRVRDFSGVSPEAFDGRGNYSLGLREQLIFPEVEYDRVDRVRGMEVAIVTSARTDDEGRRLLQLMGMPFRTDAGRQAEAAAAGRPRRRPAAARA